MGSLGFFCRKLLLISALVLAGTSWYSEAQAQSTSLRLAWTDTSDNEDGFKIERLVGGIVDATLTVPANVTSYIDSALVAGTVYCYRVEAFNSAGDSNPSNQGCSMAQEPTVSASTPSNVSASPSGSTSPTTVTATLLGQTGEDIAGTFSQTPDGIKDVHIRLNGVQGTITGVKITDTGNGVWQTPYNGGNWIVAIRPQTNPSVVDLYFDFWQQSSSFTLNLTFANGSAQTIQTSSNATAMPPSTTTTTPGRTASLRLAWTDTSNNEDGFKIERLVGGIVDATLTVTANVTSYIDSALVAGTVYCYRVEAFNSAGDSNPSNQGCSMAQEPTVGTTSPTLTLTVSPTKVRAGATVTTMWTGITAPTPKDWIGLYAPGTADAKFINRMYVSCSAAAGSARASGSCIYLLPAALSAGNYELRLFANDGFTRLTASNTFAVSTSSNSTPIVLANSVSTGKGSGAGLLPQVPKEWSDYDLKVSLRSMNNNSIGVMFRYLDDKNYYRFVWNQKSKFRRLEKIEKGTATVLANDTVGYVKGRTYQLQTIVQGTTLRVFIDGAQIFSVADSTFAEGTIGLYSSSNQASFDNIVAQDLNTGAVLLSQGFDDGAFTGWTIVDQGKNHGPSVWSATSGSLLQSGNIDGTFALYMARTWTDYRFTAKLRSSDKGPMGVMFRYQDSNDYYRFSWDGRGLRRLEKVQNGAITVLAKDAIPYVTGEIYNLEITAKGATIEIYINGKIVFSVTDSSLPRGTVALYSSYNPGSSFDDVLVQDLATGVLLVSDDFNGGAFTGWTIVDEGTDQRPSAWSVKTGSFVQSSSIGSNTTNNLGTYALY